jgi:HK97 family phage major capsid protein
VGYTSANSGTITWDDFVAMSGQLKRGYEPWYFMNRRTLAAMQGLTSNIGVPIWQPVAGNQPASTWGFPYDSSFIDLDDSQTGSGAKPVLFADLWSGYEVLDMLGMNATRDDLTRKKEAITEWTFRRYNTGRVILPEAIAVMTIQ